MFLRGKTAAEATEDILQVQLPRLKDRMAAGSLSVDNIDVFCEQGVFDLDCTRSILKAGRDMGLNINFHGDELHPSNSAQVSLQRFNVEPPPANFLLQKSPFVTS